MIWVGVPQHEVLPDTIAGSPIWSGGYNDREVFFALVDIETPVTFRDGDSGYRSDIIYLGGLSGTEKYYLYASSPTTVYITYETDPSIPSFGIVFYNTTTVPVGYCYFHDSSNQYVQVSIISQSSTPMKKASYGGNGSHVLDWTFYAPQTSPGPFPETLNPDALWKRRVPGLAESVKKIYVGVGGVAKRVLKGYVGVNGVAKLFFSNTKQLSGPIQPTQALSNARVDAAAASAGSNIIIAGGADSGDDEFPSYSPLASAEAYDESLNHYVLPALRTDRAHLSAASTGGYAIFAGGAGQSGNAIAQVDAYDAALTNRTTVQDLSKERQNMAAGTVGNKAFFAGGRQIMSEMSTVDVYDNYLTHYIATSLDIARDGIAAASCDDCVVFAGGAYTDINDGSGVYTDKVEAYNSSMTHYVGSSASAILVAPVSYAAGVSPGRCAIFAGGQGASFLSRKLHAFSFSLTRLAAVELGFGLRDAASARVGDVGLIAGGTGESGVIASSMFAYSNLYIDYMTPLLTARTGLCAAGTDSIALFMGGSTGGGANPQRTASDAVDAYIYR